MKITSSVFENNQMIPSIYTCDGSNISPPLEIHDVPEKAKSLAVVMEDPDAPGGVLTHWLIWNIDPQTLLIPEALIPEKAIRGTNSMGHMTYDGPCPPTGTHHYHFKVYALDDILELGPGSNRDALDKLIQDHIIDETEIIGLYSSGMTS